MHYDIKEIGPKGTPPTHNYLPRNKAFIVHFASSLFSLSSAAAMERQCLAMMCALCVAALCCRSGAQPGIVEETVCTNNSSAVQGDPFGCHPLVLPEFSCATYTINQSSLVSVRYFCGNDPANSLSPLLISGTIERSRNFTCQVNQWCVDGQCLPVNDPTPPECTGPPRCRNVSQLAANVSGSTDDAKFCSRLTEDSANGVYTFLSDAMVIQHMQFMQLLSSIVGLPDTNQQNCSTVVRDLLCSWIFPDCSDEPIPLPQRPCPEYCLCVVDGACSSAFQDAVAFLDSADSAFGGNQLVNPLNFVRNVTPADCSDETLRFHTDSAYSSSCTTNACVRPTTATTPPTSLPPTTTTAATATGLSDQLLALAIALPIASLLVLVLVLLAVCYCVWMRRSRDKSVENYPFTPSYNSRVGTLFGLPFRNQGSAIRSRSDLVKSIPDIYMPLLSVNKDILLQSSKINTSVFLADGSFSEVYQGYIVENHHQAQTYRNTAIKRFKEHVSMAQTLAYLEEMVQLNQVDHSNVVHLTGVGFDPSGSVLLVYPYFRDHDLLSYLKKKNAALSHDSPGKELKVLDLLYIANQIAEGMAALAQHGITYKMLSSHTCLVDNDLRIVVGDVCMVQLLAFSGHTQVPIFHRWMAPESIASNAGFSEKSDVWSFGVTCWEVFSLGANPYGAIEDDSLIASHVAAGNRLARPPLCPKTVFSIFLRCWEKDPDARPGFAELLSDLNTVKDGTELSSQVAEITAALRNNKAQFLPSQSSPLSHHPKLSPPGGAVLHYHHTTSPSSYNDELQQELYVNVSEDGQVSDDRESIPSVYVNSAHSSSRPANKKRVSKRTAVQLQRRNTDKFESSLGEEKYETVQRVVRRRSLPTGAYSSDSDSDEYENSDLGPDFRKRKQTTHKSRTADRQVYYNIPRSYLEIMGEIKNGTTSTTSLREKKSKSSGDIVGLAHKALPRPPVAKKPANVKLKSSTDSTRKLINPRSGSPNVV